MASSDKLFTEKGPFAPCLVNFSQQAALSALPIAPKLDTPVKIDEPTPLADNRLVLPGSNSLGWLAFIGKGADDSTFTARVIGWRRTAHGADIPNLWVPKILLEVSVTLSTMIGDADHSLIGTDVRFADTIAITRSVGNTTLDSPGDNSLATVLFDMFGHEHIEIETALGTATEANALLASF